MAALKRSGARPSRQSRSTRSRSTRSTGSKPARSKAGGAKPSRAASRSRSARTDSRKSLTPAALARGLIPEQISLSLAAPELGELAKQVSGAGGVAIGSYREPLSGRPLLLASIPLGAVRPTPFQRDLSPAHTKRLASKIEQAGSFLDPLIVVRGEDGRLWTPNGRHRLAAAKLLGMRQITVLMSPDETLAYRILALNTEKAHNLRDRSREVIRMARALAAERPRLPEITYAEQFEEAALLTLGLAYEAHGRFAGSAYHPLLRKLDRFSSRGLAVSLRQREGHAARLLEIEARVAEQVRALQARGFRSPYLRAVVVARVNPVRWHRVRRGDDTPPMSLAAGLTRMHAALRKFDVDSIQARDLALAAGLGAGEE